MATQGIISFTSEGKVLMKIIVGCDGSRAQKVADSIQKRWPLSAEEAQGIAKEHGFGCEECLVIMTESDFIYDDEADITDLYIDKFQDPEFNPRWECGLADHVVVVEV